MLSIAYRYYSLLFTYSKLKIEVMLWTRKRIAETPLCTVVINLHINAHVWAVNAIPKGCSKMLVALKFIVLKVYVAADKLS